MCAPCKTVIISDGQKVTVSENIQPKEHRPQAGASNYMYNAGLYYDIAPLSFSATWNFITNRTYRPSELYAESLFEQPVQSLDAQVSCRLLRKKALLKLSLSNLLDSYYVVYSNIYNGASVPFDENNKQRKPTTKELLYDKGTDLINYESKAGRSASLSFTYNF